VTVALNEAEAPTVTFAFFGLIETVTPDSTVTLAWAWTDGSATLLATT